MYRKHPLCFVAALLLAGMLCACSNSNEKTPPSEVAFELNRNIADIVEASGLSGFEIKTRHDGEVLYDLAHLPEQTVFKYTRPGYEIAWDKVHAITLHTYADDQGSPLLKVNLEHNMSIGAQSHDEVKALVDQTLAQFQGGHWQRYFLDDFYPRITGRSSLLDGNDQYPPHIYSPDPAYVIPSGDWPHIARSGITWYWIGDDVRAWLRVLASGHYYYVHLVFEDEAYALNNTRKVRDDLRERNWWEERRDYIHPRQVEARRQAEARALERGDEVLP